MKTKVLNAKGKKVKEIDLDPVVFAVTPNEAVVHQVVTAELANLRQGSASTRTRGMVRGGGRKPYRQKGTGRARAGSIRSPLWRGGGIVFGPHPKQSSLKIPRKMRRLALKSILSDKANSNELIVIDKFDLKEPATKKAKAILSNLKAPKKVTVVIPNGEDIIEKSIRNIDSAAVIYVSEISSYQLINNQAIIFTEDALGEITEALRG